MCGLGWLLVVRLGTNLDVIWTGRGARRMDPQPSAVLRRPGASFNALDACHGPPWDRPCGEHTIVIRGRGARGGLLLVTVDEQACPRLVHR